MQIGISKEKPPNTRIIKRNTERNGYSYNRMDYREDHPFVHFGRINQPRLSQIIHLDSFDINEIEKRTDIRLRHLESGTSTQRKYSLNLDSSGEKSLPSSPIMFIPIS